MILSMIPELNSGGKVGVAGCKDPKDITERLKAHGIEVKSEAMFEICNKVQTGFLFYCT